MFDVEQWIPHRGRMRLIDEILRIGEGLAATRSLVRPTWPLIAGEGVEATILIELVAQTAAVAQKGAQRGGETGEGRGWLVGIKRADLSVERIPAGSQVTTEVRRLYGFEEYHVYEGRVTGDGIPLAFVELQVVRADG